MEEARLSTTTFENRGIEQLLSMSEMFIEERFGFQALNQYLSDISELKAGVPYVNLGISQRRERCIPSILTAEGGVTKTISDPYILRNESLTPKNSIALLRLEGVMSSRDGSSSYGVQYQAQQLRNAYSNNNVSAIILEVNSGGGEVVAMNILTGALKERNKPVIGFGHYVASAAYGTIAMADEVIASDQMAEFGSIGAMVQVSLEFLNYYKENFVAFYGKNAPLKNNEIREAVKGNYEPLQEVADKSTDQFHAMIGAARPLTGAEQYRSVTLSGKMFDAAEAKRRGLIDGIGNLSYAIKRATAWSKKYSQP
jgi:ClpP class serine protease